MIRIIRRPRLKILGFLLIPFASGCSLLSPGAEPEIFYPADPLPPRIQFLTTFSSPNDLLSDGAGFSQFILGEETGKDAAIVKPYGVDIHNGIIYVVDIRGPGYAKFDMAGKKFDFVYGSFSGKMKKPINITIDKDGTKYIADIERGQVTVFDDKDDYVRSYIDDDFKPSDVVVTKDKLFVTCIKHHQVHVFDKNSGKKLRSIGKPGSNEGELFFPSNLELGPDSHLYVSETGNYRIQKFTQSGKFVTTFGKVGTGFGQFARPKGIALDRDGRMYVVDAAFENVQILDKEGKILMFFGEPGMARGSMNLPAAIAIDYDNVSYFQKYAHPDFNIEYLILVASQFGRNKVNVYGFGKKKDVDYSEVSRGGIR